MKTNLRVKLDALTAGVFLTRDLVSEPGNVLHPDEYAKRLNSLKKDGLKVTVFDKRKLKKISIPKKIFNEIEKYPMVSVEWYDIISNSNWSSFEEVKNSQLATCITKGHLLSQSKGITRIFGDYSLSDDKKKIETIGNSTLIPNSVIKEIKKI